MQRLVAFILAFGRDEKVIFCVERIVSQELVEDPMKLIAPALKRGIDDRGEVSVLSAHVARLHSEFLQSIDIGLDEGASQLKLRYVRPIHIPTGPRWIEAVDIDIDGAGTNRCTPGWDELTTLDVTDPGRQLRQLPEVSSIERRGLNRRHGSQFALRRTRDHGIENLLAPDGVAELDFPAPQRGRRRRRAAPLRHWPKGAVRYDAGVVNFCFVTPGLVPGIGERKQRRPSDGYGRPR